MDSPSSSRDAHFPPVHRTVAMHRGWNLEFVGAGPEPEKRRAERRRSGTAGEVVNRRRMERRQRTPAHSGHSLRV
jgi:hypothetical protein